MNVERFCKVNLVAAAVLGLCWNAEAALTRYAIMGTRQPLGTEVKFSVADNWNGTMLPVSDPDNTIVRTFGHGRTLLNDLPEDFCLCGIEFTKGCSSSVIRGNPFNIHSGGLSCDAQSASVSTQRFENALNFFTAAVGVKTSGANDCLFFAGRVNHLAESFGDRRFDFGGKGTIVIAGGISVLAQAGDDLQSCWEKTSQINGGVLVVASDVALPYFDMNSGRLVIAGGAKFDTWGEIRGGGEQFSDIFQVQIRHDRYRGRNFRTERIYDFGARGRKERHREHRRKGCVGFGAAWLASCQ